MSVGLTPAPVAALVVARGDMSVGLTPRPARSDPASVLLGLGGSDAAWWPKGPCPGDSPRDTAVRASARVTSGGACDNRSVVLEPSGPMLVMLQSPAPGGAPERLTLGVAARLSRYLQVLTQAQKI